MATLDAPLDASRALRRTQWLVLLGDGFLSVSIVLAGFAARLGALSAVIGLLPAIAQGGWMLHLHGGKCQCYDEKRLFHKQ